MCRRVVSKDIKGVRSRHGAIASSTQLQHLHEEVSQVQVCAATRAQGWSLPCITASDSANLKLLLRGGGMRKHRDFLQLCNVQTDRQAVLSRIRRTRLLVQSMARPVG